jgi:DNA (cytosine-5)-methyltransferase 1
VRPRLLDLFCGVGGCSVGYDRAGFDVTGVDLIRRPDYPFRLVLADALTFSLDGFDAVHASPPCKLFTALKSVRDAGPPGLFEAHTDLLTPMLARLAGLGVPWVVENVPGSPMPPGSAVYCGSSFGLAVRRHRLFASDRPLLAPPCDHAAQPHPVGVYGGGGAWTRTRPGGGGSKVARADAAAALGITHTTEQAGLSQAIPPAYTEHIGAQLLTRIAARG